MNKSLEGSFLHSIYLTFRDQLLGKSRMLSLCDDEKFSPGKSRKCSELEAAN